MLRILLFTSWVYFFPDALQGWLSGPIRALGLQGKAFLPVFIGYYAIALPTSMFLTFKMEMGNTGLWLGMTGGVTC